MTRPTEMGFAPAVYLQAVGWEPGAVWRRIAAGPARVTMVEAGWPDAENVATDGGRFS
jgi:membrane-bound lytic murein transglycosylase B